MSGTIEARLAELGVTLPVPVAPQANYVPVVRTGNLLFIAGQIPIGPNGIEYVGKVGAEFSVEEGAACARLCAINILAQTKSAIGDLDKVVRVVKLTGMINSTPDFTQQSQVVNGCSDFIVDVFGDKGRHARTSVSVASLPFGVAVEVEAVIEVE
ncbi:RidA family protein [Pannonibacter indicus]|uniref:Enamine deaminase RidA, house cleaning of reactive enamine intermediates, YjgF/YER057c/UK114 family n=1 Tax=Pannonibacter indicus TaxID=466044 RepID=A0A0K6I4Q3_9HYPH|nr:RidA family protein [Pannonibacter indicus]CUA98282.1 Enamine deaminase RidA, house cleaning of reactive enamine intermediates, YjgF/YER057c/UK114 family [Pannonibacter indicus]